MRKITIIRMALAVLLFLGLTSQAQIVTSNADDGSSGTLRNQIASATSGAIIIFAPGVDNITLTNGQITIDKSLTLTGNLLLSTTINGNAMSRIFDITSGDVNINDVTLTNGLADNGGAIQLTNASLFLSNATISNSTANGTSGSGGGIYVGTGSNLTATNVTISGNTANRAGGGIESVAGTAMTLNLVTMTMNNAGVAPATAMPGNGGGIHITGNGSAVINGGTYRMNKAAAEGGGLWNGAGLMTIQDAIISENTASGIAADNGGGGIYNLSGMLQIEDSEITDNVANGTAGSGGGILNDVGATATITDSEISGNTSNRAGGGIENNIGTVTLVDVMLNGNTTFSSPGNGGGLHVTGLGTLNITGGTVNNNIAGAEGGGLWNGTGVMTIDGTTINGNRASGALADQGGGGIYNLNGGTLSIENATISNNIADGTLGSGGGILNDVGSQLSVTDSEITGNTAVRAGGGIEDNSGTSTIVLNNVNLNNNSTTGPPGNGGGLHITGAGNVTITGGMVNGNTASLEGGGLWNGTGIMTINGTTIDGNTAEGVAADDGGGGIFNNGGTVNASNIQVKNNLANGTAGSGGGLFSIAGAITISDSTFDLNSANRAGGAIEVIAGTLTLNDTDLTDNDVNGTAGAPAPGNGGGIHISGVTTTVINGGVVSGNGARREGGGLWNQTGSEMTLNNVTVDNNFANGLDAVHGGGGIFLNGGTVHVNSSTVSNNESRGNGLGNGGGIHIKTGSIAYVNISTISGNTSVNDGGGIFNNGTLFVSASTIANNTADENGGGIANTSAIQPTVKNSIVATNTGDSGLDVSNTTGNFESLGYNLIGQDATNVFPATATDIEGTQGSPANPMLAVLANNGGPTMTHQLQTGSPAYNAGNPTDLFNDQTNSPIFGGIRDIGSYEAQSQLGVDELAFNNKKSAIYPNPAVNGTVNILLADNFGNGVNGRLIELGSGKVVKEFTVAASESGLNISEFASGIYAIHLSSDGFSETHKLVIGR